jgi:general secretion pathway protein G
MRSPSSSHSLRFCAKNGAFTLVELLVTITIIAILLGLGTAAASKVLEKSRETKCVSQLGQIGSAIILYAGDHDGSLPRPTIKPAESGLGADQMWGKQLGEYLPLRGNSPTSPENEVFVCPSAKYTGVSNSAISRSYIGSAGMYYFSSPTAGGSATSGPARKMVAVQNPSQTILAVDGKQSGSIAACASTASWSQVSGDLAKAEPGQLTYLDYRHGGNRMSFLYADGHVEAHSFLERDQILRPNWEGKNY